MNYEQAIRELQDNLIVIAEIEKRQSALLKEHSENIFRIDQNLAEITDKLNGLIGYVDGQGPRRPS